MPDDTTILSLPLILPAQAQKHVTHNEALVKLDLMVQLAVINRTLTAPPPLPTIGDRHIVAAGATGAWVGQAGRIAMFTQGGWQFTQALPGWQAYVVAESQMAFFNGLNWIALSDGPFTVGRLGVSATPDATNRLAVSAPATLFNHAGSGHQLKLNKAVAGDTASLLFQTGFGGRAEMGTAGSDDFSVKVSADGSAWSVGLVAGAATGEVTLPQPVHLGGQAVDPSAPVDGTLWLNTTTGEVKVRSAGVTQVIGGGGAGLGDGDKGDITVSGSGTAWTIDAGAVSLGKLADMATGTVLGRASAGTGSPEALDAAQATALLDTFTSAAKGLTPASGGGTANFLRADGTWAAPAGGGGGTPGGASGELQYNNAGAFAGAADVRIEGGQLRLPVIASPTAPAAGGVKLYGGTLAGMQLPEFRGTTGGEWLVQPHLGFGQISIFEPAAGTTVTNLGLSPVAVGTASSSGLATTTRRERLRRIEYLVTTAAATAVAGWRSNANNYSVGGVSAWAGGFYAVMHAGPSTGATNASHRFFMGFLSNAATPTDVNPSTLFRMVGLGYDATDTQVQIMSNDASGTATKIALGASFPKPNVDRVFTYRLELYSPPGSPQSVSYRVTHLEAGAVAEGTLTADLPATSDMLQPYFYVSVGGVSSVVGLALGKMLIGTEY